MDSHLPVLSFPDWCSSFPVKPQCCVFFLFLNNLCIFITKPCLILYQNLCLGIVFIVKWFSLCCLFSVFILTSHDTLTAQCLTSFDYLHTTATEVNTNANCFFFFFTVLLPPISLNFNNEGNFVYMYTKYFHFIFQVVILPNVDTFKRIE